MQDLEMIEEWNEYGEIKEALGVPATPANAKPAATKPQAQKVDAKKENVPAATSEQNLAIRQLGAEAAKAAAAKKHVPTKISTTNPLLSEKIKSPAVTEPQMAALSAMLSPRSTPLPPTPKPEAKVASGAKSPTQPVRTSLDRIASGSFSGATKEDTKEIELEKAIKEGGTVKKEESSKTEDTKVAALVSKPDTAPAVATKKEDEDEDEDEDDESDEKEEITQKQSAKAADKAGESVKD
jgi:hypothetical protein